MPYKNRADQKAAETRYWHKNRELVGKRNKAWFARYRRKLKASAYEKLGGKCAGDCQWLNADGSRGCIDWRCLQIDHINGGGSAERKELKNSMDALYRRVLADTGNKYQLLCANCNWIKLAVNRENDNCYGRRK